MHEDLKEFFRDDDSFSFYEIDIKENKYIIKMGITNYTCFEVQKLFHDFLVFIGYHYMNLYSFNYEDDETIIEYLTLMDENTGTQFLITYFPVED